MHFFTAQNEKGNDTEHESIDFVIIITVFIQKYKVITLVFLDYVRLSEPFEKMRLFSLI